ncbi:C39 family peptidase [Enterococcus cecorum]|uniref:Peptidase C39-like domain-containing protein n=1 Tax=Enterococcus cecorum TaxID=44008 RepID=A0A366SJY9_9ENTE|nr:C39 family peptidase [Enterococcus cecorum]RBR31803.1 hypothetical protein EB18_00226 [Enterococcus cecorum]
MKRKFIAFFIVVLTIIFCLFNDDVSSKSQVKATHTINLSTQNITYSTILLDVPLESQFEGQRLENGCEVTALSMLLQYYGYDVNKNVLASQLQYEPFSVNNQIYGDPRIGFVGDIQKGNRAMGVFVEPIAQLARKIVNEDVMVHDEKITFDEVISLVQQDIPIWCLITVDFIELQDSDFIEWPTNQGNIKVTPKIHAAVITGMDSENIYVNDPYGYKNRPVKIETMKKIFEKMGAQSLYFTIN